MRTWVIYSLGDPRNGVTRYVGVVTHQRLQHRLSQHLSLARRSRKYHLTCWIGSLLDQGAEPVVRVLESGEGGAWAEAEAQWILRCRAEGADLTNATNGGEGCPGHVVSPEAHAKIRAARLGKPLSKEHRAKVAAGNRGKQKSREAIANTPAATRGRRHSVEARQKMSLSRKGQPGSKPGPETIAKRVATMALKKQAGWVKKGTPLSQEARAKVAAARRGQKHTLEVCAKIRAAKRASDERRRLQ